MYGNNTSSNERTKKNILMLSLTRFSMTFGVTDTCVTLFFPSCIGSHNLTTIVPSPVNEINYYNTIMGIYTCLKNKMLTACSHNINLFWIK